MKQNGKDNLAALRTDLADARLGAAIKRAIRELDRCYQRTREDEKRIGSILGELGSALRERYGKPTRKKR